MTNSLPEWTASQQPGTATVSPFSFDVDLRNAAVTADSTQREAAERTTSAANAAGYAAGWAEGRKAAASAATREMDELRAHTLARMQAEIDANAASVGHAVHALAVAANRLDQRATPGLAELEQTVVLAAFTLAESVIGHELAISGNPGVDAIARALAASPANGPITVHLSPGDLATVTQTAGAAGQLVIAGRPVVLLADSSLQQGDAIAECDATTVDARIQPAIDRIKEVLFSAHQG